MKNKKIKYIVLAAALYAVLLTALLASELSVPDSSIRNFGDSLWYSIVTLTTVGYGDMYPVSAAGRAIGVVFILMSPGVFAAVFLAAAGLIRYKVVPYFRLRAVKSRSCCFFSEYNEASEALAMDILRNDPEKRAVFCNAGTKKGAGFLRQEKGMIFVSDGIKETLSVFSPSKTKDSIFLISEDICRNYADIREISDFSCEVYCRGSETPDFAEIRFFDAPECCARLYWQEHPLSGKESLIIIVGDKNLAQAVLDQAVLVNARLPFKRTAYHVFGDWEDYENFHPELKTAFTRDENDTDKDLLIFHEEAWNKDVKLLEAADRIIFCGDDPAINAGNAVNLKRYFAVRGTVYTAAKEADAYGVSFGDVKSIFTEEMVIRRKIDRLAGSIHEEYDRQSGSRSCPWDELSPFLKNSNRAAADHLLTKLRLLLGDNVRKADKKSCAEGFAKWNADGDREAYRRNEHERWLRFHCLYNWTKGEKKDGTLRKHPCVTTFDELTLEEQEKDDNAWKQMEKMADSDI